MTDSAQPKVSQVEKKDTIKNPYFLSYEENASGFNKSAVHEYTRLGQSAILKAWPYVHKALTFIVFDGLRFFKSFMRYALRQIGILK